MMDKLKKNMVFYLLLLIDFYIVPWFIKDTGSAMIVMLVIIPLICLITSVFYGIRNGFNFWYILIVAIMFAPSIFIFYNSSAWVYVVGYAVIALLGNLIALPLGKDNFKFTELNQKSSKELFFLFYNSIWDCCSVDKIFKLLCDFGLFVWIQTTISI